MQGTEVGSLYYDLNIDSKKLGSQLDAADKKVKGFGDRVNQYWGASAAASKKFMLGVAAAGAVTVAFGVSSVKAFQKSQDALAQTNAVLKSTHGVAGMTTDSVLKLATALESQTKFADEDIQSVENLLLTFTAIGKNIMPQATETVLNMATALGEDTKSASIQLGKALQDPILGVTALRRVGVNFNSAQTDVIKNLVNTGHSAKAQALIMAELQKEFGGSAKAAGTTFAGAMAKLKNQFNNVQEAIGGLIARGLTPLLTKMLDWFNRVGGVNGVMKLLTEWLNKIRPYFPIIAGAIAGALTPAIIGMTIAFAQFLLTIAPWMALGAALVWIWTQHHDWLVKIWNIMQVVGNYLMGIFIPIWRILKQVFDFLYPSIVAIFNSIIHALVPALVQAWDAIVRLWRALNPALMVALKIIAAMIGISIVISIKIWLAALNIVIRVLSAVISVISNVIKWISNLIGWFGTAAVAIVRFFISLPGKLKGAISGIGNILLAPFKAGFNLISDAWNNTVGKLHWTVPKWVPKLGGHTVGAPQLPHFAFGGIVPGPIGTPQLAVVHGGELVVPANKSGGAAPVFNIGQINNQQDENWVLRRLDRNFQLERMGLSPTAGG